MASSAAVRSHATKRTARGGSRPVVARVPAPAPAPRDLADLALGVYCWD
ncbi:MAG TPA: hypothetical protein VGD84_09945 [Pseudonocardiaceae bacterium]